MNTAGKNSSDADNRMTGNPGSTRILHGGVENDCHRKSEAVGENFLGLETDAKVAASWGLVKGDRTHSTSLHTALGRHSDPNQLLDSRVSSKRASLLAPSATPLAS